MPVGPSHSGRSRSSSGGGISFGGGSRSSSGGSRSFSSGPRRHGGGGSGFHFHFGSGYRMPFFGRTVVLTNGLSALLVLAVFAIVCFSMFAYIHSSTYKICKLDVQEIKQEMSIMEKDADEFKTLIQRAESGDPNDQYYLTTATFGHDKFEYYDANPNAIGRYHSVENDGVIWYFVVYQYHNALLNRTQKGTTYTQYSAAQCTSMDGEIEIAYGYLDGSWWSINTDYSLEKNQDYKFLQDELALVNKAKSSSGWKVALYVGLIIATVGITGFVLYKKSKSKQEEENLEKEKAQAEVDKAKAEATMAQKKASQIARVCTYCGCDIPDGDKKCPGCGSSNFD